MGGDLAKRTLLGRDGGRRYGYENYGRMTEVIRAVKPALDISDTDHVRT